MKTYLSLIGCFFAAMASADDYTVQGVWTDNTTVGGGYVPQYHVQCQVDAVQVYENLTLATPGFSTVLVFNPGQTLECRGRNNNIVIAGAPINGNWSVWAAGLLAEQPVDVSGFTMTIIHQSP